MIFLVKFSSSFLFFVLVAITITPITTQTPVTPYCTVQSDCDPDNDRYTTCRGGQCECADPIDSIFLVPTQTCFKLATTSCQPGSGRKKCIPNSHCVSQKCQCDANLVANVNRLCFLKFQQQCDPTRDLCDPAQFLKCGQNSICECGDPENTMFEGSDISCRLLANSPCTLGGQRCLTNSLCNLSNICECSTGYSENQERHCVKSTLNYGEPCNSGNDLCSTADYLYCNSSSQCDCRQNTNENAFYDPPTNKCFLLYDSTCVPNEQKCAPNSKCLNGVCQCKLDLHPNRNGRCFKIYNETCNRENGLCDPETFLGCGILNTCTCALPHNTTYNPIDETCRVLSGSVCTPGGPQCIDNSNCDTLSSKCTCAPGFLETEQNMCERVTLPQGQSCVVGQVPDLCDTSKFLECNSASATCECKIPPQGDVFYDQNTDMCYLLHDSECERGKQKCAPNSKCLNEVCQCKLDLHPNPNGRCFKNYNETCNRENDLCDPATFLGCGLLNTCTCALPHNTTYNPTDATCRVLSGSVCNPGGPQCIDNSNCDTLSGKCTCAPGFLQTEQNMCERVRLPHGQSCVVGQVPDLCDTSKFLECNSASATCECKIPPQGDVFYDQNTDMCYLLHDSECERGKQKCAPNSKCLNEVCQCKLDLHPNPNGRCFKNYNETCNREKDLCDPATFLGCGLRNKCICAPPQNTTYESMDGTCRILIGSICTSGGQKCTLHSDCDVTSNTCVCTSDFVENESHNCERVKLNHGDNCIPGTGLDLCDTSKFIQCNSATGICECEIPPRGNVFYDKNTDICYLLHSSECSIDGQKCAPNSDCLSQNGDFICQCERHLEPNWLELCFIPYNKSCRLLNDLCDPYEWLTCKDRNKCDCENYTNTIFQGDTDRCHLLHGASCIPMEQPCIANGFCEPSSNQCECSTDFHVTEERLCLRDTLNFGENCSPGANDICDRTKFLHCNPTTTLCDCEYSNSTFDSSTQVCLYLAEADCSPNVDQNCIPNAHCNRTDHCQCNDGLYPNAHKFCYARYRESCNHTSSADLCDPHQFLECSLNGICDCANSGHTWYNQTSQTCEILIGGQCIIPFPISSSQNCVDKAFCNSTIGICQCDFNFTPNSTLFCNLKYSQNCTEYTQRDYCNPENYFECGRTKRCSCQNYQNSYYDDGTDYCHLVEGAICTPREQKCGPNSKCIQRKGDPHFKCTCDDGLLPNEDRRCFLPYNSSCSAFHDLCDPSGFLHCSLLQKCDCHPSHLTFYNRESKRCQLLAQSECSLESRQMCVENAVCLNTLNRKSICQCFGNFTVNPEGHCRLLHGVQCSQKDDKCESGQFLTCTEYGHCDCQNVHESYYDRSTQYCYLLAGSSCIHSEESQQCIQNSFCDPLKHVCTCSQINWALEINRWRHCAIPYMKNCSESNDLCDKSGFLYCTANLCDCHPKEKTWYNPESKSCELRAGMSCSLNNSDAQNCYQHSICLPIGGGGSDQYKCTCLGKLTPNINGLCYLKHDQLCELDDDDICDPAGFLSCEPPEKKCACNLPNTIFNSEVQSCQRLPEGQCSPRTDEPQCIPNSHCDVIKQTCVCDAGYEFAKGSNACLKSHGEECTAESDCNHENQLNCIGMKCVCRDGYFEYENDELTTTCLPGHLQSCDANFPCYFNAKLECLEGVCQCHGPSDQVFDTDKRKCVGLVGSTCTFGDVITNNNTDTDCVPNASCVLGISFNGTIQKGICECNEGFKPDSVSQCYSGATFISRAVPISIIFLFQYFISEV